MQSLNRQKFLENYPPECVCVSVYSSVFCGFCVFCVLYIYRIFIFQLSLYFLAYNTKPIALLRMLDRYQDSTKSRGRMKKRRAWHRKVFLFLFFFISAFHIISSIGILRNCRLWWKRKKRSGHSQYLDSYIFFPKAINNN